MDDDIEDIKKLDEILKKENENQNVEEELDDLLDYVSEDEELLEGFDSEPTIDFVEFDVNRLDEIAQSYYKIDDTFRVDLNHIKHYLDTDEVKILNSCTDPELKKLMLLNRAKYIQMQNVHAKLYNALKRCTDAIRYTEQNILQYKRRMASKLRSILPSLGHPYFKMSNSVSCRPNQDTIRKRRSREISVDYMPQISRWTSEDQLMLKRAVIFNYYNSSIERLESELRTLYAKKKFNGGDVSAEMNLKIETYEGELALLKNCSDPEVPPINSVDINWVSISNSDLLDRHSPYSCEAFWNIYLHPSVNKSNWTDAENVKILKLAEKYKYQDWEAIASELGNNRSGFSVCVHYYARISDKYKKDRFLPEEDEFVLEVINACRIGSYIPWTKVAHYFDNRTKTQIYHRYKYHLAYDDYKKGTFSPSEDVLLLCLVHRFGTDFKKCHEYLRKRTPIQLSHRYTNYLKSSHLTFGNWTVAEDNRILEHVEKHGSKNWGSMLTMLRRNRSHLRFRYIHVKKWIEKNPGKPLEEMPRKKHHFKQTSQLKSIRATADIFNNSPNVPSIDTIRIYLRALDKRLVKRDAMPKNHFVDSDLIRFFQNTCKIKTSKKISEENVQKVVDTMKTLFTVLDVRLEIPDENLLKTNPLLDELDVIVLNQFRHTSSFNNKNLGPGTSGNSNFNETMKINLLPPNINTLIGLRSMLITCNSYKEKLSKRKIIDKKNQLTSSSIPEDTCSLKILTDRQTFEKRLKTLFEWPALMSIVEPQERLNILSTGAVAEKPKIGRPKKDLTKVNLMALARRRNKVSDCKLRNNQVVILSESESNSSSTDNSKHEQIIDVTCKNDLKHPRKAVAIEQPCVMNKAETKKIIEVTESFCGTSKQSKRPCDTLICDNDAKKNKIDVSTSDEVRQLSEELLLLEKLLKSEHLL